MQTVKINHNPESDPIKFPSEITYLKVPDEASLSEVVEQFAKKNKQIVITYDKVPNQWLQ
jgi:hypothetical protein